MHFNFHVMHMTRADVVLGHEWLHGLGLSLKCSYQHNTLTFDAHGANILMMGHEDVLFSPMIYNAELHSIINKEKINNLVLCYLMHPSLYLTLCVSQVLKYQNDNDTSSRTSPQQLNVSLYLTKSCPSKKHCNTIDDANEQL